MKTSDLKQLIHECVREVLAETRAPGEVWKLKSGKWSSKSRGGRIGSFSDKKTAEKHARSSAKYGKQSAYKFANNQVRESTTNKASMPLRKFKERIDRHEWYVEVRGSNKPTSLEKVGNSGTLLDKQLDAIAKFKIVGNTVYLTP